MYPTVDTKVGYGGGSMTSYHGPGDYIAIVYDSNWSGHAIRRFTIPDQPDMVNVNAMQYYLSVIDHISCPDRVYPAALFDQLTKPAKPEPLKFGVWQINGKNAH